MSWRERSPAIDLAAQLAAEPNRRLRGKSIPPVRPAAPVPPERPLGWLAALKALRQNPITAFPEGAYEARTLEIGRSGRRLLLVNDPAAIQHILVDNATNYRKSVQQRRLLQPALGDGLLTAEGEAWRSARRIAAPLFSPRAIGALFDDMSSAANAMTDRWRTRGDTSTPLDLVAEFQRLTYEIVSRTVFSGALDEDRIRVHAHMAIYFETLGRLDLAGLLNLPPWLPTPARLRARPALQAFRSVVDRVVGEREQESDREIVDLLDRLMAAPDPTNGRSLPPEAVSDNVLTFLAAGHETTGNALAWTLYLLALFPEAAERAREEVRSVFKGGSVTRSDLDRLVFTRAVINETLRLYPPAPFMGREALGPDRAGEREIPAGAQIVISPWIVHRHRGLWPQPDSFCPERFLLPGAELFPRGSFIPFGLGPRICIGQGFAVQEILTVLATILPGFRFTLADAPSVFPQARITLQPRQALAMRVEPY